MYLIIKSKQFMTIFEIKKTWSIKNSTLNSYLNSQWNMDLQRNNTNNSTQTMSLITKLSLLVVNSLNNIHHRLKINKLTYILILKSNKNVILKFCY